MNTSTLLQTVRLIFVALLMTPITVTCAKGIDKRVETLRAKALQSSYAFGLLKELTQKVGSRFAGTEGDAKAVKWAKQKLEKLGFENVRTETVEVPRWIRGKATVKVTKPSPKTLVSIALGGSVGTSKQGVQAEVVAVKDIAELEKLPSEKVKGKIVFFYGRTKRTRNASGYIEMVSNRTQGPSAAAKWGAIGLVIRSVATSTKRIAHTGMTRYKDGIKKIPAFAISNQDADELHALIKKKPVTLRLHSTSRMDGKAKSANVIGEIVGTDQKDQIVLMGAHLDTWDVGTGAVDDGAGVAIVVEAARIIRQMKVRPRKTIRVVLYANEEFGLSGAFAYFDKYKNGLNKHVLAMEADLGAGRIYEIESRFPKEKLPLMETFHAAVKPLGISRGSNKSFGGADLIPIRDYGVPVVQLRHDATKYFDYHHSVNDTLDKVSEEDLRQCVAAYATTAYLAAAMKTDFGRNERAK